jgi:hypothetical protein
MFQTAEARMREKLIQIGAVYLTNMDIKPEVIGSFEGA